MSRCKRWDGRHGAPFLLSLRRTLPRRRYSDFWRTKILRNIERDAEVNQKLKEKGWTVVRLWESDIRANLENCVKIVKEALFATKVEFREE